MPPRFTYWTIIAGGQPTAFRAATQDELLPTLRQLQSKQPDAVLMWFARGKLWPSEEASAMALRMEREGAARERRGPDWRPGGEHKDPRDRFKVPRDVKRSQFAARARRERIEEQGGGAKSDRPPGPRPGRPAGPAGPRSARPTGPTGPAGPRPARPTGPTGAGGPRPARPTGGAGGDRPFRPRGPRPGGSSGSFRGGPSGSRGPGGSSPRGGSFRGGGKKGGGGGDRGGGRGPR